MRIVFTGMGCSAIVSDVVRGFFIDQSISLEILVVNDYDFARVLPPSIFRDPATLFIISSYSGHSKETILAFEALLPVSDRVILLTSGGKLAELGNRAGASIVYWKIKEPDREYPLFHVTQYFAILLDMLYRLGMLEAHYSAMLSALPKALESNWTAISAEYAAEIAFSARDANILLLASPLWYECLLKLCKMHLNEIAMAPASRNYLHEFCHSEVATLTRPERKHVILLFVDEFDDVYTKLKAKKLSDLVTEGGDNNIVVHPINLVGENFAQRYFGALELIQWVTVDLGRYYGTGSRDLISRASGNWWYNRRTIETESRARTVASD